jgi:hypothetical protein
MMSPRRWLLLLVVAVLAALFAYLNGGERATLHLGFVSMYRVSVPRLVLGSFLLGMLVMWGIGLRHDLRVRRVLREHGITDEPPETVEAFPHEHV